MATPAERLRIARKRMQRSAEDLSAYTDELIELGKTHQEALDGRNLVTALELGKFEAPEAVWAALATALNQHDGNMKVSVAWLCKGTKPPEWAPEFYGSDIQAVMDEHKLSRTKLAERIGVAASTLHNCILNHQRLGPAATTAIQGIGKVQRTDDLEPLLRQTVAATCIALRDEQTMAALETLSKSQDVDIERLLADIIIPRVLGEK